MEKSLTTPRLLLGGSLSPDASDIQYATGFTASDPFLFAAAPQKNILLVSPLEAARAKKCLKNSRNTAVLTPNMLDFPLNIPIPGLSGQTIGLAGTMGWKTVAVGPFFPVFIAQNLEKYGIKVEIDPAAAFPAREIKTAAEIRLITASQQAAVSAIKKAILLIKTAQIGPRGLLKTDGKPLTAERLKEVIEIELLRHNCVAVDTITSVGTQTARPHDQGTGPIYAGNPVVLDIFPRNKTTGYWGDITRTVVKGPASPELKNMYKTVLHAQKMALTLIRPGIHRRDIQEKVEHHFHKSGYETRLWPAGKEYGFIHSVGHGVGLDIHEAPGIRHEAGTFKKGHVVTVEPGLYYPKIGGIRIEDTVVVTASGCKILATCPKVLEI